MMGKHRKPPDGPPPTYPVGYRVPPESHKFPPKKSGNPNGRPRKLKTVHQELHDALMETVTISYRGRQKKVTRQRVILLAAIASAQSGNIRAATFVFDLRDKYQDSAATVIDGSNLSADERALLEDHLRRSRDETSNDNAAPAGLDDAADEGGGGDEA